MNDDSVLVWAKLKNELPELVTFSICTWVKFTYEVRLFMSGPFLVQKYTYNSLKWFRTGWNFLRQIKNFLDGTKNDISLHDFVYWVTTKTFFIYRRTKHNMLFLGPVQAVFNYSKTILDQEKGPGILLHFFDG